MNVLFCLRLCFLGPKRTSFPLSQAVLPSASDPTCCWFYCFTAENFYPRWCNGLWNQPGDPVQRDKPAPAHGWI